MSENMNNNITNKPQHENQLHLKQVQAVQQSVRTRDMKSKPGTYQKNDIVVWKPVIIFGPHFNSLFSS